MNITEWVSGEIKKKTVAIVRFGPAGSDTDGFWPAEYFQVTIDPTCVSPSGEFVRLGLNDGDEIVGWQRTAALTIVEILGEWNEDGSKPELKFGNGGITMMQPK